MNISKMLYFKWVSKILLREHTIILLFLVVIFKFSPFFISRNEITRLEEVCFLKLGTI